MSSKEDTAALAGLMQLEMTAAMTEARLATVTSRADDGSWIARVDVVGLGQEWPSWEWSWNAIIKPEGIAGAQLGDAVEIRHDAAEGWSVSHIVARREVLELERFMDRK